jgi:penicillin-binding protein 2
MQTLAEKALGPRIGSVVILKPSTGEILALASYPTFDPNAFTTADGPKVFQALLTDTRYPFLNRAIQATYPPASTFKIIMSAAVLGDGVIDPRKQIFCGPEYKLGDRVFKEHDPRGFGWTDMPRALAQSANVYFYTVGVEFLGIDRISRYAKEFGLGAPSGIDIPGELSGQVPDPHWKEKTLHAPWLGGDTANTSIGQGYLQVTPLQMADAIAMVANGGKVYRPHVLKEVRDPVTGNVEETDSPEVILDSPNADKIFKPLQDALRGVITGGTPEVVLTTRAVQIAGKTGTGEDGEKGSANHSWFVSYAPYDDPDPAKRLVVVVQVERTNTWEWWAPKAANIIFQGLFAHQTYEEALKTLGWSISAP